MSRKLTHRIQTGVAQRPRIEISFALAEELLNYPLHDIVRSTLVNQIKQAGGEVISFPDFQVRDRVRLSQKYINEFASRNGPIYRTMHVNMRGTIDVINDGEETKFLVKWDGHEDDPVWYEPQDLILL